MRAGREPRRMTQHEPGRQDGFRRTRRAPQPAHPEERPEPGAHSPAAVWGNPAAAPDAKRDEEPGERLARERRRGGRG